MQQCTRRPTRQAQTNRWPENILGAEAYRMDCRGIEIFKDNFRFTLQCFDGAGWAAGRASGL